MMNTRKYVKKVKLLTGCSKCFSSKFHFLAGVQCGILPKVYAVHACRKATVVVLGGDGVEPPWPFLSLTVVTLQTVGARRTAAKPAMSIVPACCSHGKERAAMRSGAQRKWLSVPPAAVSVGPGNPRRLPLCRSDRVEDSAPVARPFAQGKLSIASQLDRGNIGRTFEAEKRGSSRGKPHT